MNTWYLVGRHTLTPIASLVSAAFLVTSSAFGSISVFKDQQAEWLLAAGPTDTIDFVLDTPQILKDQYSQFGVTFTGGDDFANFAGGFALDGWGAQTDFQGPGQIEIAFDVPRWAFAAHYPGTRGFIAFADGQVIYEGLWGGSGSLAFLGIVSDVPFDEVWLISAGSFPAIDNIYFSQAPIPSPGAMALLGLGALTGRGRRRTVRSS